MHAAASCFASAMKPLRVTLGLPLLLAITGAAENTAQRAPAAAPPPAAKASDDSSGWVFSLLPKSLQQNPRLELTVMSEMTPAGRQLPPVSPQQPAYFELFTTGPRHMGHSEADQKTLKKEEVEKLLTRSLAANGYRPAKSPEQPPTLLILYTWGAHSLLVEGDEENPALSGQQLARNILDRAALVGGEKFAAELLRAFEQADAMAVAARSGAPPGGEQVFTPELFEFANPVNMFKRRSPKNEMLVDQTASNVYYVVASAYDYRSFMEKRRLMLWRTRMTVASAGVSAEQSLPTLVLTAAPYFGKDLPEAEVLTKRTLRDVNVEIGTPTIVESDVKLPAKK